MLSVSNLLGSLVGALEKVTKTQPYGALCGYYEASFLQALVSWVVKKKTIFKYCRILVKYILIKVK